ncbi:MAG TPA: hypothetical protein VFI02_22055, partial [Armatimonadota bacterium]|nr:hypothetical protein [Armatimonadota bacterium]
VKGSEWAWQNRRWESVEQFKKVQRTWVIWAWVLLAIAAAICIAAFITGFMAGFQRATHAG